jgi:hypothetical protein
MRTLVLPSTFPRRETQSTPFTSYTVIHLRVSLAASKYLGVHVIQDLIICQSDSHCCSADMSFCRAAVSSRLLMLRYTRQSSAKIRTGELTTSGRSLIKARNKSGAMTVPCTPFTSYTVIHLRVSLAASKFLGVHVIQDLSWNYHIQQTSAKASRSVGFLRRSEKSGGLSLYPFQCVDLLERVRIPNCRCVL